MGTCVVTFKAQSLSKYNAINKVISNEVPYIKKGLLCFNCYRFGHLGKQCNRKTRCNNSIENHVR